MRYHRSIVLIITLITISSININSLNIANRLASTINKLRNKDAVSNALPKIVPLKEKKNLGTKVKGVFKTFISVPIIALKGIKDVSYLTTDTVSTILNEANSVKSSSSTTPINIVELTKDSIINNIEQTKENIGNVGDAIIEFPSSVANDVSMSINDVSKSIVSVSNTIISIPNTITTTSNQIKRTVKTIVKVPGQVLGNLKGAIDSIYDIADKLNGVDNVPQSKGTLVYNLEASTEKSPSEIIEEIKEAVYMTADTVSGTINVVQDTIPKVISTIEEIPTIPTKVVSAYKQTEKDFNDKVTEIQTGFENAKENTINVGKILYKIITLEAAKETVTSIGNSYNKVVSSIEKTKATVASTKEFIENLSKPKPPPPPPKVSPFEEVSASVSAIGNTVKATGEVMVAGGRIGFVIAEGLGKIATIAFKRLNTSVVTIDNIADDRMKPEKIEYIIPIPKQDITPIPIQDIEKEKEFEKEKDMSELVIPGDGEWK